MVADAVYTLMKHRVPTIYARTVMELLSGDENLMLRPERKAEMENSIRKMIGAQIGESYRILAKDRLMNNDTRATGLNNNDLVIGPGGAGKTRGYVKPSASVRAE